MIEFKIGPDYTIATDYSGNGCVVLDEWIGKTLEQFSRAMGRPADNVESFTIGERTCITHSWTC